MRRMIYRWLCKRAYRKGLRAGREDAYRELQAIADAKPGHVVPVSREYVRYCPSMN